MSIRIRYKGVESDEFPLIHPDGSQAERTLLTAGKYCEDDITVISDILPTEEVLGNHSSFTYEDGIGMLTAAAVRMSIDMSPETGGVAGYYAICISMPSGCLPSGYTATWKDPDDSTDTDHTPVVTTSGGFTIFKCYVDEPKRVFDPARLTITANGLSTYLDGSLLGYVRSYIRTYAENTSQYQELYRLCAKVWFLACVRSLQS